MAKIKLTAAVIRDFKNSPGAAQAFLWDNEAIGLGVRATAGGKAFIFQAKLNGKTIRVTIGDVDSWGIEAKKTKDPSGNPEPPGAREEARRLKRLLDLGIDPRIAKQEQIAKQERKRAAITRQEVTLGDAWPVYIEAQRPKWSIRHYLDHVRAVQSDDEQVKRGIGHKKPGPLTPLLGLKLSEITPARVKLWAESEAAHRGTQTRIAFDALRGFLNWCSDRPEYKGLAHSEACASRIKRNALPKKKAKSDCLQREQLRAWFAGVRESQNPVISAYLQTLLLTGARREELAGLLWDDLDFRWKSMTIHDKVDGLRTIPLTPFVASLLAPLPRRSKFVFSSPTAASGRIQEPRKQHNQALAKAGIDGLTLHGLRRSFGTLSEWSEVPAGVVAQIQGHKPSATAEKHYRVRPLDLLRQWHEKVESWILAEAGIEMPKEGTATGLKVVKSA